LQLLLLSKSAESTESADSSWLLLLLLLLSLLFSTWHGPATAQDHGTQESPAAKRCTTTERAVTG
jgi:hypothetical protein